MGNRAMVRFQNACTSPAVAVCVYLHWQADNVRQWLNEAAPRMRKGDASYAAARFIGFCHENTPGGLSLGVECGPGCDPENGLYVVDCDTGKVTLFREGRNGYLARSGRPFTIKMGAF
jgi:hypothetical protein